MSASSDRLPVIDIEPFLAGSGAGDARAKADAAARIRAACIEWGFFYITGALARAQPAP